MKEVMICELRDIIGAFHRLKVEEGLGREGETVGTGTGDPEGDLIVIGGVIEGGVGRGREGGVPEIEDEVIAGDQGVGILGLDLEF
jgi:hypothetical protein